MVTLYTTGCPRCRVLEKKLGEKNISYSTNMDVDEMTRMGFSEAPILVVDDVTMDFGEAVRWINNWRRNVNEH